MLERLSVDIERVNWFSTYHVHHRVAASFLEANRHTAECQRLAAVVRELVADPARAIETSGDT